VDEILEHTLKRRWMRKELALSKLEWAGFEFDVEDIATYACQEGMSNKLGVIQITSEFAQAAKQWWESIPLNVRVITEAGILVPLSLVSLAKGIVLPDLDIKLLGIGWHRYFLFHSAAASWLLKKFCESYKVWVEQDKASPVFTKIIGAIGAFGAVGVGLHLMKDAIIDGDKSIVFGIPGLFKIGTLLKGTSIDDDLWLISNGLYAFKYGRDILVLAFGEDIEAIKQFVNREFRWEGKTNGSTAFSRT